MPLESDIHESSFRDHSGFVFVKNDQYYRQVNISYKPHYDHLLKSELYAALTDSGMLLPHEEINTDKTGAYKILKPQQLDFISYPYEWSFSMLKDAALLTLKIQEIALRHGMILKDASAYNIQFHNGKPVFIDSLSFEIHREGNPWQAYGQFCRHFLSPLALMSYTDITLNKLLITHLDGIPLDIATKLLPVKCMVNLGLYMHLFLHAKMVRKYATGSYVQKSASFKYSSKSVLLLTNNLSNTVSALKWRPEGTEWDNYYAQDVEADYLENKKVYIKHYLLQTQSEKVLDLGANTGTFSLIAAEAGKKTYSFDIDPACVEQNYLHIKNSGLSLITPLVADATNPSPGIGWFNLERSPLWSRVRTDVVLALALLHHLSISNHIPFAKLAIFFSGICKYLIIEFVPKSDEKVKFLLGNRPDIFDNYTLDCFEKEFKKYFTIVNQHIIAPTERILFFMQRNND